MGVYSLLLFFTKRPIPANVVARLLSGTVNFTLNRKLVFKSNVPLWPAAFKYFLLTAGVLLGNTVILSLLVTGLSIDPLIAKPITEGIFFGVSWSVQKKKIFADA